VGFNGKENSERVENSRCTRGKFSTNSEAVKSYIWLSPDENNLVTVRNLNNSVRRFGNIIIHSIMLIQLLFG